MQYDAVILPGGGVSPDGSLSEAAKTRLEKAAWLYLNNFAKAIIVCGSHSYKAESKSTVGEAQAYASYLESLHIPSDGIYQETKSQETLGNILFAKMNILLPCDWHKVLVIPTANHSAERIQYLLQKILGPDYTWEIQRVGEDRSPGNLKREAKSLQLTKEINDIFVDGDHISIHHELM